MDFLNVYFYVERKEMLIEIIKRIKKFTIYSSINEKKNSLNIIYTNKLLAYS